LKFDVYCDKSRPDVIHSQKPNGFADVHKKPQICQAGPAVTFDGSNTAGDERDNHRTLCDKIK